MQYIHTFILCLYIYLFLYDQVRFKLDSETQNPTDVAMYAMKESNALVEEWMLLANITG